MVSDPFISVMSPILSLILFSNMPWNYLHVTYTQISISSFDIDFKTCTFNCILHVSIYKCLICILNKTKKNKKKILIFLSTQKTFFLLAFPIMTKHWNHLVVQGKNLEFILDSYLNQTHSNHQYDLSALHQSNLNASTFSLPIWPPSSFSEYYNNLLAGHQTSVQSLYYLSFNISQNDPNMLI